MADNTHTNIRVYKKTAGSPNPTYALYHPQTGGDQVFIASETWSGTGYTSTTYYALDGATSNTASSTYAYVPLEGYLKYINDQIENFGGVLEFIDARSFSDLPNTNDPGRKGNVYIVNDANGVWWGSTSDTTKWQQYPQNTLFVCVDGSSTRSGNYINTSKSVTGAKQGWVPLGGANDIYARKTEAFGKATLTGNTLTFSPVSGTTTLATITFDTIGTVAAGTSQIVSTIPTTGSDSAIPNVEAVRNYASSAGQVTVETVSTGNLIVVSQNVAGTQTVGVTTITVTGGQSGTPTLGANITGSASYATTAGTATTANQVANALQIAGTNFYDGSATRNINFGDGLICSNPTGSGVAAISVDAGTGIDVNSSGVSLATVTSITISRIFSVVSADKYGRVVDGAQAFVFVPDLSSADLSSLAVGGLAFVGTGEVGNNAPTGGVTNSNIS